MLEKAAAVDYEIVYPDGEPEPMSARTRRRGMHPLVRFFRAASLALVLVVIGLVSALTTMHFAIHGAEVQIPALKGMTVADARSQTAGLGLNLVVDNRYYSSAVAAGHILTQSPDPERAGAAGVARARIGEPGTAEGGSA